MANHIDTQRLISPCSYVKRINIGSQGTVNQNHATGYKQAMQTLVLVWFGLVWFFWIQDHARGLVPSQAIYIAQMLPIHEDILVMQTKEKNTFQSGLQITPERHNHLSPSSLEALCFDW